MWGREGRQETSDLQAGKKKKNPPSCRGKADAFTTRLEVERVAVLGRVSHTQWVWFSTMNACDSRDGEDGGKTKDSCH